MQLDNLTIAQNIASIRKLKDIKASDMASRLGLSEAAYTKYERGETAITIEFVQRVADVLEVNPVSIVTGSRSHFLQSISNSYVAIQENSTFQTTNDKQNDMMLKLMESVLAMNERILGILEQKR